MGNDSGLSQTNSNILHVLRIGAAWMVLLGHSFSFYHMTPFKDQSYFPYIQNIGVVILFELSGFLTVYSLYNKNRSHDYTFKSYVKQRACRIGRGYIPALFLILLVDFVSILINGDNYRYYDEFTIRNFLGNVLMLQNIPVAGAYVTTFGSGRPLWTLSIEWWIYMAFGSIFLILANKRKVAWKELLFLGIALVTPLHNLTGGRGNGLTACFLLGVFAYFVYDKLQIKHNFFAVAVAIAFLLVIGIYKKEAYSMMFFMSVFLVLITLLNWGRNKEGRNCKVISFLSGYTFMLYLIHYSIIDFILRWDIPVGNVCKIFLGIILSNVAAVIMYCLFEQNKLWKNRGKEK